MRISVALCTWNGGRFLGDQLASIAAQTHPPHELIVCDDGSEDDTLAILERFRPPFPVRLQRNPLRLGVTKNFQKAIELSTGDAVALADQDDVWYPQKLSVLDQALDDADLVFSNARRVDAYGRPLPGSLWDHIGFRNSGRPMLNVLVERNVVTGATMAFRTTVRDRILPIPNAHGMLHDQWIALIVAASGRVRPIAEQLIDYRVHEDQERGIGKPAAGLRRWFELARNTGPAEFAQKAAELKLVAERIDIGLGPRIAHLERRAALPPSRLARIPAVLGDVPAYVRYSNHLWSLAKDLLR
jgi:glycosyltransferase involved in cell wall biosynthesis